MPESQRRTVFRNARLVDGTGAPPRAGVDVVLEGGRSPFVTREISGTVGYSWSADGLRLFVSNFRGSAGAGAPTLADEEGREPGSRRPDGISP